jgi:hypothetical protein
MAFMSVSIELMSDPFYSDLIYSSFEKVTIVERRYSDIVLMVTHPEIEEGVDDVIIIFPYYIRFDGIKPFIVDFGLTKNTF